MIIDMLLLYEWKRHRHQTINSNKLYGTASYNQFITIFNKLTAKEKELIAIDKRYNNIITIDNKNMLFMNPIDYLLVNNYIKNYKNNLKLKANNSKYKPDLWSDYIE